MPSNKSGKSILKTGAAMAAALAMSMSAIAEPVEVNGGDVYSFGDSLSDGGNFIEAYYLANIGLDIASIFGFDPIRDFAGGIGSEVDLQAIYQRGRFSNNGMNWVDYIRQYVGTAHQKRNPLLGPIWGHRYEGTNFAHGGAVISSTTSPGIYGAIPFLRLSSQTKHFADYRNLRRRGWFNWGFDHVFQTSANDYATLSIGGNDFKEWGTNAQLAKNSWEGGINPWAMADSTMLSIQRIQSRGLNQIFVMETPDVTLTPLIRGRMGDGDNQLSENNFVRLSGLVDTYNNALDYRINRFEAQTGAEIYFVRVNALLRQIVADVNAGRPALGGFTNVTDTCLKHGLVGNVCNSDQVVDTYLFYDPFHPTSIGYDLIAQQAMGTLQDVKTGKLSGFARTSALSEQVLLSNQLLSTRMSSFVSGDLANGTSFADMSLAFAVNGQMSGLGFHQSGAPIGENKYLSFYRYVDGHAPGFFEYTPADEPELRMDGRSLDMTDGEWSASYGADIQFGDNMMIGAAYSQSEKNDNLFSTNRQNDVENVTVYGMRMDGSLLTGLSVQATKIQQDSVHNSNVDFIGTIGNETESKATTIRLDNQYMLPTQRFDAAIKTKVAYSRHDHDGFRSRSRGGLIDNTFASEMDEATVAYIGGEVSKSLRLGQHIRTQLTAEAGMLATSSSDIGFSPVLDDTLAINPDIDPIGFADPIAGLSDTGVYSAFGAELKAGERFSIGAEIGTLSTERGSQQVGRIKAGLKF